MVIKGCEAAIFDLDGIITETAKTHFIAWKEIFDEFLKGYYKRLEKVFSEFSKDDYLIYVDGKPRYEGVASFLKSREIELPEGSAEDSIDEKTICGLGNKKNKVYKKLLKTITPKVFESTIELIKKLKNNGVRVGVASSSKNTRLVLRITKIESLFESVVDGNTSRKMGLKGKPAPDIFIQSAKNLKARPSKCIVIEDAVSGVKAGQSGNFGLVIGVKRGNQDLSVADIVVNDLKEISISEIKKWFSKDIEKKGWNIEYYSYKPEAEGIREALSTIGNGYICTRGCHVTEKDSKEHYPGTYLSGIYNKTATRVHGKEIWNNDLVNCPNWSLIKIKINNKEYNLSNLEIIDYNQELEMKQGVLKQELLVKDEKQRITKIISFRFASMDNPHLLGLKFEIIPKNYDADLEIISAIDGNVKNNNVLRYRNLNGKHLKFVSKKKNSSGISLVVKTSKSNHQIAISCKNKFYQKGKENKEVLRELVEKDSFIGESLRFKVKKDEKCVLEKVVSVYNSLDCENPEKNSIKEISKAKDFNSIFKLHKEKISLIWKKADVKLNGDIFTQRLIRLNIYHLIISTYYNKDYGIPARGFHGESYRGHIFWDELFVLPFFDVKFPEISKSHLRYRYNGLNEAKKYAKEKGYEGAMYPWQTADKGDEETQIIHYNPKSQKWGPDYSQRQRHVSIAIFYDFFRYYSITHDSNFLRKYGAEVMVEIAKFWASLVKYNKKDKKYHISGVMGPDEFHEKLPNSKEKGLEDNAYTNVMVSWLLKTTLNLFEKFPDKIKKKVSEDEKKKWKEISNNLKVRIKNGIVEQFKGYFDLKEFDWGYYKEKYNDIRRLDRILKAENKSPDDYKVSKQADFLMLYYNLGVREVSNLLKNLGIKIEDSKEFLRENYNYYLKRTSHGSTLSKIVYGVVSTYIRNGKMPRKFFEDVLLSDFSEEMNATTSEGIHTGSMAGSLDFFIRRYAGVNYKKSRLKLYPQIPKDWQEVIFKIKHRGIWYDLRINHNFLEVKSDKETKIEIYKKVYNLKKREKIRLRYDADTMKSK